MSADRMYPPKEVAEIVEGAIRRAHHVERTRTEELVRDAFERGRTTERARCADVAALYPVFAYDGDTGELLRLRDNISQAIEKLITPGQPIP